MAPGRTLKVKVLSGTVNQDGKYACTVKLLDLALRELKKETFKTKIVPSKNGLSFQFPVSAAGMGGALAGREEGHTQYLKPFKCRQMETYPPPHIHSLTHDNNLNQSIHPTNRSSIIV